MERRMEVQHLEQADVHIDRAEKIIRRQQDIIDGLERNGRDAKVAKKQLLTFEDVLDTMQWHRNIIRRRIVDIDGRSG